MRIALIGSASSSVRLGPYLDKSYQNFLGGKPHLYPQAPFIDEEWEIWGCSPGAFGVAPRADRWFEVHRWEPGQPWFSPEYCQFLKQFKGPVYTGGVIPEIPNHVVYPLVEVEAEFSSYFLTSSLSLMMAIAIFEIENARKQPGHNPNDDVIGLWGVDMAANEEYAYQRPGCHFFILEALRRGIGVFIPPESDLMRPLPVYGLSEWDHMYIKLTARSRELNARAQAKQQEIQAATTELNMLRGCLDDLNYNVSTWGSPYGVPAGMIVRMDPGPGLGGNFKLKPPVVEEVVAAPAPTENLSEAQMAYANELGLAAHAAKEAPTVAEKALEDLLSVSALAQPLSSIVPTKPNGAAHPE